MSVQNVSDLPVPDAAALEHSANLAAAIASAIDKAGGSISFERYMQMALYEPGLGYYSAGAAKFGSAGDFVTAPEISSLFGACIARHCANCLAVLDDPVILEFGAGSGKLAADLLASLAELDALPERYLIMEVSADLRQRQQETLAARVPQWLDRIEWLDSLPEQALEGVVVANEVIDAMPIARFRVADGELRELRVSVDDNQFVWQTGDFEEPSIIGAISARMAQPVPDGYQSEFNPVLESWMQGLAAVIKKGSVLLVDYGMPGREYYDRQRTDGTLMCHYRHRAHPDPFLYPGLQDITAHVDFTALAEAGEAAGFELAGYTTQAFFLMASGLQEIFARSDPDDHVSHLKLSSEIKTLTLPGEMGERFKVMAFSRGDVPISGFDMQDLRSRL